MMLPNYYGNRAGSYITPDNVLSAADYAISAAGVLGAETTAADLTLCLGQAARLAFAPESVEKPLNTGIKTFASVAFAVVGEVTGEKRMTSAFDLITKGFVDYAIKH